jgi:hypothetical protein
MVSCGSSGQNQGFAPNPDGGSSGRGDGGDSGPPPLGGHDGSAGTDGSLGGDAAMGASCAPNSSDQAGCSCPTANATRACYPLNVDPHTRNVGSCKDGMQTCVKNGEFNQWGACTGAVTPTMENCAGMVDNNCNGKVGCNDPSCASDPTCNTGCTNGQTRPCYDGPAGTENVGICKDGTQTCANGQWPSPCTGEVTPQPENCCDALDHNCNGLPGCFDFFSCITAACCQVGCDMATLDPGCVCPNGTGDTGLCPAGDHLVTQGGNLLHQECCPCTDCTDINCCGNAVCNGSPNCAGLNCQPLPASCNGQVSTDCDDFPEDCDEPCCQCTNCP